MLLWGNNLECEIEDIIEAMLSVFVLVFACMPYSVHAHLQYGVLAVY